MSTGSVCGQTLERRAPVLTAGDVLSDLGGRLTGRQGRRCTVEFWGCRSPTGWPWTDNYRYISLYCASQIPVFFKTNWRFVATLHCHMIAFFSNNLLNKVCILFFFFFFNGFSSGSDSKESTCQCRRLRFDPWVGKIPWRRKWQPTPVFLPGKFHEQRSLVGCSPWGRERVDTLGD